MAVVGKYIAWRIRSAVLPFVRIYGQWVDEHVIPMASQLQEMAENVQQRSGETQSDAPSHVRAWLRETAGESILDCDEMV